MNNRNQRVRRSERRESLARPSEPDSNHGARPREPDCVLCKENVARLQGGRQIPGSVTINGNSYTVLPTPFGFQDRQFTLASADHEPQSWLKGPSELPPFERDLSPDESRCKLERVVGDLAQLTRELPDYYVIFNSQGSLPRHLHLQCFRLPAGHPSFPLQIAARSTSDDSAGIGRIIHEYPIPMLRVTADWAVAAVVELMRGWEAVAGSAASFNAIGCQEAGRSVVYLTPRNKLFRCAPGGNDAIECLEILGEVIVSRPDELALLASNQISFDTVDRNLRSVVDQRAVPLLDRCLEELIRRRDSNVRSDEELVG